MRILVVGSGGVGAAVASIARHRSFFASLVLSDLDADRAQAAAAATGDSRISGVACDASDAPMLALLGRLADGLKTPALSQSTAA